ncbi:MAG TPA: APC family permease [Acidimicrobiia bacterium]|nr:APC family permease [Acidimicrobiia bacterium]
MNATWARTKGRLIGSPIPSAEHEGQLLPKSLALPVFASDPLSSVAYATEEIALVLALAGTVALSLIFPIALGIAALMAIVVVSYRQTVRAYPDGGGAFIVANDNLGLRPAMVAAASLLTDYVLTVAVSISAGMAAITSALPALVPYRVPLALGSVLLLTLANLRGVREASRIFAAPTYVFVVIVFVMLGIGFVRCLGGTCPQSVSAGAELTPVVAGVSMFLVLRAFASGASALTGTEAIANGVQAFRPPKPHNAALTLGVMGALAITMFLGISTQAQLFDVRVSEATLDEFGTVLSQIGRAVFGTGAGFIVLQAATAAILVLAANTAYQDFPRLSAILAAHRLMPRQYRNRGDRLAFSNGIITVSLLAALLIVAFGAQVSRLIQLYVVGVFTSFTLSQTGMVRHWLRERERGWRRSVVINAVGAATTGVVLIVVAWMKFMHGAWIILVAVPLFVAGMAAMRRHYLWVASRLRQVGPVDCSRVSPHRVVVLASRSGRHLDRALRFAGLLHPDYLETWHVEEPGDLRLLAQWNRRYAETPLRYIEAGPDGVAATLRRHVRKVQEQDPGTLLTVVVAEDVRARRWRHALRHREGALGILWALRQESGLAVADVHCHPVGRPRSRTLGDSLLTLVSKRLVRMAGTSLDFGRGWGGPPRRVESIVLVSEVTAPTLRAVQYACTVCPGAVRALHVEIEPEQRARVEAAWVQHGVSVPLEVVPSPYRDLTATVLQYLDGEARRTGPETLLNVIIPEFVVPSLAGKLLHNQSALWVRAALYADNRVAVTSVPWVLGEPPEAA